MNLVSRLLHSRLADQVRFEANRHLRGVDEARRLLLVGAGARGLRGYVLERLFALGYPVTLLCEAEPTWERAFIDAYLVADFSQPEQVAAAVLQATRGRPVRGCLTYVEANVPLAALLSQRLGLCLYPPEVAERVRDKHLMRTRLAEAGLPMPRLALVQAAGLRAAVAEVGLPAVFKPVRGEGSIQVLKLTDEASLVEAERLVAASREDGHWRYGGHLVEEYLDGVEYSVESVVQGGQISHAAVTDKYKSAEPYFEEIGHTVPALLDEGARAECLEMAARAIRALSLDNCAVHTELKRGSRGPVIIEVGGRLGGDRIPRLVEHALGIDLADAAAQAALGTVSTARGLLPTRNRFASVGFFVPARQQVQAHELGATPRVPGLVEFEFWGRAGQTHRVPPAEFLVRLGYAITVGDSYALSRAQLEQAREQVTAQTGVEFLPFPAQPQRPA